jgi:hypothetical protein
MAGAMVARSDVLRIDTGIGNPLEGAKAVRHSQMIAAEEAVWADLPSLDVGRIGSAALVRELLSPLFDLLRHAVVDQVGLTVTWIVFVHLGQITGEGRVAVKAN